MKIQIGGLSLLVCLLVAPPALAETRGGSAVERRVRCVAHVQRKASHAARGTRARFAARAHEATERRDRRRADTAERQAYLQERLRALPRRFAEGRGPSGR